MITLIRFLIITALGVALYLPFAALSFVTAVFLLSNEMIFAHQVIPMMQDNVYIIASLAIAFSLVRDSFFSYSYSSSKRGESCSSLSKNAAAT